MVGTWTSSDIVSDFPMYPFHFRVTSKDTIYVSPSGLLPLVPHAPYLRRPEYLSTSKPRQNFPFDLTFFRPLLTFF